MEEVTETGVSVPTSTKGVKSEWKKNLRRVPDTIALKIERSSTPDLVAACTRKVALADIKAGAFAHVGIEVVDGQVTFPKEPLVPSREAGKYSERNIDGREIVRKDLPMTSKTFTVDAPNYGDWSNGSHEVAWTRDVYQREYEAPRNLDLSVALLSEEADGNDQTFVFQFKVNAVLRRGAKGFADELLYALNVLQENVGAADIFPADATRDHYLKTINVAWEILPPGEMDATIAKVLKHFREPSDEVRARIRERYQLLTALNPSAIISGTSGFARYFGAQFADNLVVFENLEYGNAIYVMFEEWETLSQQSRLELLQGDAGKFVRIVHREGWQTALKVAVEENRPKTKH